MPFLLLDLTIFSSTNFWRKRSHLDLHVSSPVPGDNVLGLHLNYCSEWWDAGILIYLERSVNDLHTSMVQLMSLPPIVSCFIKSRMVYLPGDGLPRLSWKRPLNVCVCVCMCVCVWCWSYIVINVLNADMWTEFSVAQHSTTELSLPAQLWPVWISSDPQRPSRVDIPGTCKIEWSSDTLSDWLV